jgi:hypothetical protein
MQSPPGKDIAVIQGRVLALIATLIVPFVIASYGVAAGHPPFVVFAALIIWGTGTTFGLRSVWTRLRADNQNKPDPPAKGRS